MGASGVIAGILITLAIGAAGIYFGLPYLFPNVVKVSDKDAVVQEKYVEFGTNAYIADMNTSTDTTMMNGTVVTITTQGNTSLYAHFETMLAVDYRLDSNDFYDFNITIAISGVGSKSVLLQFTNPNSAPTTFQNTLPFSLSYGTGVLPSGNYTISMLWQSLKSLNGGGFYAVISSSYSPGSSFDNGAGNFGQYYNNTRSLLVQEITA